MALLGSRLETKMMLSLASMSIYISLFPILMHLGISCSVKECLMEEGYVVSDIDYLRDDIEYEMPKSKELTQAGQYLIPLTSSHPDTIGTQSGRVYFRDLKRTSTTEDMSYSVGTMVRSSVSALHCSRKRIKTS